jgi:hypothetical protein
MLSRGGEISKYMKSAGERPTEPSAHIRLAGYLSCLYAYDDFSLLDVGGGEGVLSLFLPQVQYVLVEPTINGISGTELPFEDKSFDIVVSCHVLEHVPPTERFQFLGQLCTKARRHVLLLNPFSEPNVGMSLKGSTDFITFPYDSLTNEKAPNDYLVEIDVGKNLSA